MKKILILFCLCGSLNAQDLGLMAGFDFPNATFYSHDLGESIGLSFGAWMGYFNQKESDTPYYISLRSGYYTLAASDDYGNKIKRTFANIGAGIGFHMDRTIWFAITGGYMHTLTAKAQVQRSSYGTPVVGGELMIRLFDFRSPSNWELHLGVDIKRTVWDIEGLDRGPADRHTGSYMGSLIIRWAYIFQPK